MNILKFGGTSMNDEGSWQQVLEIISHYERPFIIVSATAHTTRKLVAIAETALHHPQEAHKLASDIQHRHQKLITNFLDNRSEPNFSIRKKCQEWIKKQNNKLTSLIDDIHASQELSPATRDLISSIGEQLSSYLFAQCGQAYGLPTTWIDAADIMRTNSDFGQAAPDIPFISRQATEKWQSLPADSIPVMGGFYGQDEQGNITTLGFEGSDYSASIIGSVLSAESIEIWTDVSGIYTCDPRIVDEARPIPELSFQEATELAYFGAKVLHPSTTKPASQEGIPIKVKNIFESDAPGTHISKQVASNGVAKAMAFKEEVLICTITSANTIMGYEFLSNIFTALHARHLSVDVVTTTEASVSIALSPHPEIADLVEELRSVGTVTLQDGQGIISLVGCHPNKTKLLTEQVLEGIGEEAINMISYSNTKQNFSIVLDDDLVEPSVKEIHRRVFS